MQTNHRSCIFEELELAANRDAVRSRLLALMLAPGVDTDDVRCRALRCALHWWRSVVDPAHVPLPQRARRRPGLTRADVAELAGLSLAWYTTLEIASPDHTCSPRTVDRIADALQLDPVDRAILQTLASRETFRSLRVLFAKPDQDAA